MTSLRFPAGVLFDLDGTLLDSAPDMLATVNRMRAAGLELEDVSGLMYEPWRNSARVVSRTDVNYLACAVKP